MMPIARGCSFVAPRALENLPRSALTDVPRLAERRRGKHDQNAPILEMRNISKAFGGVQALRDVYRFHAAGKVHALLGENGAGKSTLSQNPGWSLSGRQRRDRFQGAAPRRTALARR
jgi:ABC-type glutathione transport system ATPase component